MGNAVLLSSVTPGEATEMSWFGAEIIHPFTMDFVIRASVPIRVKCTGDHTLPGKLILVPIPNI